MKTITDWVEIKQLPEYILCAYDTSATPFIRFIRERTCHNTWDTGLYGRIRFRCSACGAASLEITPRFCPNCGARVVEEVYADGQS